MRPLLRVFRKLAPLFFGLLLLPLPGVWGQPTGVYLTAATLYLSVDYWGDIWLNGIPIKENRHPVPGQGYQTIKATSQSLCYFRAENVLALEVSDTLKKPRGPDPRIGVAYIWKLRFSDGTEQTFSSNEIDQHQAYFLPNTNLREPKGWTGTGFNDSGWFPAKGTGTSIPSIPTLQDPETSVETQFLSAASFISKVQYPGERHLFRRKFSLNRLIPNPSCGKGVPPAKPSLLASLLKPKEDASWPKPLFTVIPSSTPFLQAIKTQPSAEFTGKPALFIYPATPTPTSSATPVPTIPAELPSMVGHFQDDIPLTVTAMASSTATETVTPNVPTPAPAAENQGGRGQTIVFDGAPANIYLSFADGPGTYRLEVFDGSGRHLRNLFEQRIVAQNEAWVDWDGKDDQGQDVPPGQDVVLFSRDGVQLKKIIVIKPVVGQ
jgi:hypothetical protein